MVFITISTKNVICPLWKEEIILRGKYLLSEEKGHQYEAKFLSATCPIVENLSLPKSKQNTDYAFFRFCNHEPCELLKSFKSFIDIRDGYSQ